MIQRYSPASKFGRIGQMDKDEYGIYVSLSDHLAEIQTMNIHIDEVHNKYSKQITALKAEVKERGEAGNDGQGSDIHQTSLHR